MVVLRERPAPSQSRMSSEELNDVIMEDQEQKALPEVSNSDGKEGNRRGSWTECVRVVQEAKHRAVTILSKANVAKELKMGLENEWVLVVDTVQTLVEEALQYPGIPEGPMLGIAGLLTQRGIESEEEWEEYIKTVEKDGKLINESCEMFDTGVFQLKQTIEAKCSRPIKEDGSGAGNGEQIKQELLIHTTTEAPWNTSFQEAHCPTGKKYLRSYQKLGRSPEASSAHVDADGDREIKMSSMIQRGRSLGMTTQPEETDLIGSQIVIPVKFLGEQCNALVDTGSMISINPIEIVARAQDRGFDVDSLSVVPKSKLKPVFDASNNEMKLMSAVYIQVETEGRRSELIAFHISPAKEAEVIIGTNALNKLGVEVSIDTKSRVNIKVDEETLVPVKCEGDPKSEVERVIWPKKRGGELEEKPEPELPFSDL
ncbi:hypothetical protein OSTOST_00527 [Ostertagia ostertagi]